MSLALANQFVQLPRRRGAAVARSSRDSACRITGSRMPRRPTERSDQHAAQVRFSASAVDGISLVAHRADDGAHGFLRADFVGIDSRAGGRVLRLPAVARSGADRRVLGVRPDAVLRVLRVHAGAAVLPDRHLGRAAAAVRGDQVLPVHVRRQPGDAGRPGGARCSLASAAGVATPTSIPELAAWPTEQSAARTCAGRAVPGDLASASW